MTTASTRDNLRPLILRGLGWKAASQVFLQISRVLVVLILARLLTPAEFGLAAMVLAFSAFAYLFADLALGSALVRFEDVTEDDRSTVFWTTVAVGAILTLTGIAAAKPIAAFYGEPEVAPLFAVFSLTFLFNSLAATHAALLTRAMSFRSLEIRAMLSYSVGAGIGIATAARGYGAWALVWQQMATALAGGVTLWVLSPWRPQLRFSIESLRKLGSFSGNVFGSRMMFYLTRNVDNILIGRYLGAAALGVYALAYNVMLAPTNRIATPIQQVLFPAFSRMQDDIDRLRAAWLRVLRLVAAIAVPALAGLMVVATEFVEVLLGGRWSDAVPVLQVLAWVGLLQSIQRSNGAVLLARGRADLVFRFSLITLLANVIAFVVGLNWGIVGVAVGYAAVATVYEPIYLATTARCAGTSLIVVARTLVGIAQATAVMVISLLLVKQLLISASVNTGARLLFLIILGLMVYAPLCIWRCPEVLGEVRVLVRRQRPSATRPASA